MTVKMLNLQKFLLKIFSFKKDGEIRFWWQKNKMNFMYERKYFVLITRVGTYSSEHQKLKRLCNFKETKITVEKGRNISECNYLH